MTTHAAFPAAPTAPAQFRSWQHALTSPSEERDAALRAELAEVAEERARQAAIVAERMRTLDESRARTAEKKARDGASDWGSGPIRLRDGVFVLRTDVSRGDGRPITTSAWRISHIGPRLAGIFARDLAHPAGTKIRPRALARPDRMSTHDRDSLRAAAKEAEDEIALYDRPVTRGDCLQGEHAQRPCPFISCRHSNYSEVTSAGAVKLRFPHLEPHEMTHSCALDEADRGGMMLEEVGEVLGFTRERARQLETKALERIKAMIAKGVVLEGSDG